MKGSEFEVIKKHLRERIESLGFSVSDSPVVGDDVLLLDAEMQVAFCYAHLNYRREYVFKIAAETVEEQYRRHRHFFYFFICESSERVFVVPIALLVEILHDTYHAGNKFLQFSPRIKLRNGTWYLHFWGKYDVTDYLNRYDFLVAESQQYSPKNFRFNTTIEVKTIEEKFKILAEDNFLRSDSLHAATVDMLRKIGEWYGFEAKTETILRGVPDFPYAIDCVWYKGGDIYLAIEVCHHGVVEKDKDALKLAKQHGARKVIIVSEINKVERIRRLFMLDGDIKHWTEVWSFERVLALFENGSRFFKDFEKMRRYGWQENLTEYI